MRAIDGAAKPGTTKPPLRLERDDLRASLRQRLRECLLFSNFNSRLLILRIRLESKAAFYSAA